MCPWDSCCQLRPWGPVPRAQWSICGPTDALNEGHKPKTVGSGEGGTGTAGRGRRSQHPLPSEGPLCSCGGSFQTWALRTQSLDPKALSRGSGAVTGVRQGPPSLGPSRTQVHEAQRHPAGPRLQQLCGLRGNADVKDPAAKAASRPATNPAPPARPHQPQPWGSSRDPVESKPPTCPGLVARGARCERASRSLLPSCFPRHPALTAPLS